MKKLFVLIALVILFSGGTAIKRKVAKPAYKPTALNQLDHIVNTMDSTTNSLDHSATIIQNLQQ